ncbi:MAG: hypothetical protein N2Z64_04840 [Dictyoglomus thermophilum]|uniref:Uncharacterized protein n=1 Tax=Dictyoglomus thermophilum TaxID=14 RepID=A0A7C3Q0J3_DICTH|nr:hypothetical protein [Dictyoglomus thermophilum]MCX7720592.1 hypothetical protein [Dictyoglomus thermophilum]TYT24260.1 hypothetical protein FY122_01585 [Dictyoglomus thermophilum]
MKRLLLSREVILSRIKEDDNFAIAEHYLRRPLEAVFDIGIIFYRECPKLFQRLLREKILLKWQGIETD